MNSSTSTSRHWLLFYLGALLLAVGIGWVYAARFEPETQFWVEVFEKRRSEMTERSDESHVIFTGDSACAFGIDTTTFQGASKAPAFNLGGTRQMGIEVFMAETLRQTRSGDIVVLICNPKLLAEGPSSQLTKAGAQMALAMASDTNTFDKITASRPGFNHLITHAAKIALRRPVFAYRVEDYQVGGLITTDERPGQSGEKEVFEMSPSEITRASRALENWAGRCEKAGASLVYLMPLEFTAPEALELNSRQKEALRLEFLKNVPTVHFPEPPRQACSFDAALFADTLFHLTEEGAATFSRELAPGIAEIIEKR
ncbi:hypothetical protein N9873_03910 [Akkermansiaceae bacterium]|nr:hypothetical protein [Akkermansiaceae bacterium]MDB4286474.1 hypothetical protein [bacterium]MDB4273356.1 hypothetical protein [Akkermansiaceae bacterium]MDB4283906.1 hypothetical protein [Akkermansiaceae bacterium]MDB4332470.1 hypothetical protein [Akkermansiaceae bacterium]